MPVLSLLLLTALSANQKAQQVSGQTSAAAIGAPVAGRAVVRTNLLEGADGTSAGREVVLTFDGEDARIDLLERGKPYALHMRQNGQVAWSLDGAGRVTPLPTGPLTLVYEVADPCSAFGMLALCNRQRDAIVAGRACRHWRYQDAAGHGPFGSSSGEMWLDAETGLLMAYLGQGGTRNRRWEVLEIHFERPAAGTFLPKRLVGPLNRN